MLKKLFYASASILMLALAYHFGATSATAQVGAIEAPNIESVQGNYFVTFVVGRTFYQTSLTSPSAAAFPAPVPGAARIIATGLSSWGFTALLENCDAWAWNAAGYWQSAGNVFGPTPAAQPTWGKLKAGYRK